MNALIEKLERLESVANAQQTDSTTVSDVRELFDAFIESFPDVTNSLISSA